MRESNGVKIKKGREEEKEKQKKTARKERLYKQIHYSITSMFR
jgi:hypothetical protein